MTFFIIKPHTYIFELFSHVIYSKQLVIVIIFYRNVNQKCKILANLV